MMLESFFKSKKIFITGHTGFKGSWLSLLLTELGAEVTGFSIDIPTSPSHFDLAKIQDFISDKRGDINNFEQLQDSLDSTKPDIIVHMAAQSLVSEGYNNPVETFGTNIMGTVNLLQAVRNIDNKMAVLIITSDKCYENKDNGKNFKENDRLGGFDPYSNSKACAELVTSSFRSSFYSELENVSLATARAGNVIGGGDWSKNRIVTDCINSFISDKPVILRNPKSIRPWQHVLDPLCGYLLLLKKMYNELKEYDGGWNFGPSKNNQRTVSDLVSLSCNSWPNSRGWSEIDNSEFHESGILQLDSSKSNKFLDFNPKWDFDTSVKKTIEWYYKVLIKEEDARQVSINQIRNYLYDE